MWSREELAVQRIADGGRSWDLDRGASLRYPFDQRSNRPIAVDACPCGATLWLGSAQRLDPATPGRSTSGLIARPNTMIQVRRSQNRGHANFGWLDARYTFSFASYHDPDFMGFSKLRVLNQDLIQPGQGFPTHAHQNMEIITYMLDGILEHRDSMGNGSQIRPGEVQLMSAGSGVTHSEFNASPTSYAHLLQMWIQPAEKGLSPRYDQRAFSTQERNGKFCRVVSPDGADGSLEIGQDASMYAALLEPEAKMEHHPPAGRSGWLHVARGNLLLNGHFLSQGDGAAIRDEPMLSFEGRQDAELILFDLP